MTKQLTALLLCCGLLNSASAQDAPPASCAYDRAQMLVTLQPPPSADLPPIVNGYIELDFADGQKRKIRWPPNIDVVDGLIACFGKPYSEAYGGDCRALATP